MRTDLRLQRGDHILILLCSKAAVCIVSTHVHDWLIVDGVEVKVVDYLHYCQRDICTLFDLCVSRSASACAVSEMDRLIVIQGIVLTNVLTLLGTLFNCQQSLE